MNLNFDYTGKTLLKNWWQIVKSNFQSVQTIFNTHQSSQVIDHPDKSVTAPKLADKAVTSAKLSDSAVTTAKIADSAVKTNKIGGGAVTSEKLLDGAVTSAKIGNKAVGAQHIADSAVGSAQIKNSSVTSEKLSSEILSDIEAVSDIQSTVNSLQNRVNSLAAQGQKIVVDSSLKSNSENPVQNKVIKAALENISEENLSSSLLERIGDMYGYKTASVPVSIGSFTLCFECTEYETVDGDKFGKLLCRDITPLYDAIIADGKKLRGEISSVEISDNMTADTFEIVADIDTVTGMLQSLSYTNVYDSTASYPYALSNGSVALGCVSMKDISFVGDETHILFKPGNLTVSGRKYRELSELETTNKSSVISAINENYERISALEIRPSDVPQTDDALSDQSENPVQNKVIKTEIDRLESMIDSGAESIGSRVTLLEEKGDIIVDSALSSTSTNPVQNKAVKAAFDSLTSRIDDKADDNILNNFPSAINGYSSINEVTADLNDKAEKTQLNSHANTKAQYTTYGHVELNDAVDSTSDQNSGQAASCLAVKTAYDRADEAYDRADAAHNKIDNFLNTNDFIAVSEIQSEFDQVYARLEALEAK